MSFLYPIAGKLLFIVLLMAAGVLAKRLRWISDDGEKDLSKLMLEFAWPALIFSSITRSLNAQDILDNIWLPLLSFLIHLLGFFAGLAVCRLTGWKEDRRKLFVFHATMNNFLIMALPFAQMFYPDKGAALLSTANLGSTIAIWTLGVSTMAGGLDARATVRNLISPGLVATILAVALVLSGLNRFVPAVLGDALAVAGQPTLLFGLLLAGTQIWKLGRGALKFDAWNILVGLLRIVLIPGVFFLSALALRGSVSREGLVIVMLVAMAPASVNSISLAIKYGASARLAAEGVLFTHFFSLLTMPVFVLLIDRFLL